MAFNKKPESKIFNKRNVIGLIIVFVMVSSLLAVWQGSYTSLDNYNGFRKAKILAYLSNPKSFYNYYVLKQ